MSTRYANTSYNRGKRVERALRDVYARAIAYHFTADHINEVLAEKVYRTDDYRRLTAYQRGYVAGLREGYNADIWRNRVIWMLGPASGPTRQVHSEWTEEMSTLCRLPGQLYGGHFWKDDKGEPTDRMFTEYKATN